MAASTKNLIKSLYGHISQLTENIIEVEKATVPHRMLSTCICLLSTFQSFRSLERKEKIVKDWSKY